MPPSYAIVESSVNPSKPEAGGGRYAPRGGARALWKCRDHEVILSGPAETGKTYACLQKLDALLWKYPRSQAVMVRKTQASIHGSALQTYLKVIGPGSPVKAYGGALPKWFDYPNGSRLWLAGMDNPGKALSSERDFIYINQAEELFPEDYETLTTRCTGRAGNAPYPQVFSDCNPGAPTHWIKHRPSLRMFESRHEDNPLLFDDSGAITDQGRRTLAILDNLTGARKLRLRFGIWAQSEGVVYEGYDPAIHLIDRFPIPWTWRRIRSIDFGYTNPFVCQWWAIDPDERLYLYREIYMTGRTVAQHAPTIIRLTDNERVEATPADHDREDRATLEQEGISTIPARKDITPGIQAVEERLRKAGDGKPRIYFLRDSLIERDEGLGAAHKPVTTADEFAVYMWPKQKDGRPVKEVPMDLDNHGMDAMRYAVAYLDLGGVAGQPVAAGFRGQLDAMTLGRMAAGPRRRRGYFS